MTSEALDVVLMGNRLQADFFWQLHLLLDKNDELQVAWERILWELLALRGQLIVLDNADHKLLER